MELAEARRAGLYNIGEVARRSGVTAKMIRHYESLDLLRKPRRTASGYRVYDDKDVHTLRFMRRARDLGFSIKEIQGLVGLWQDRNRASAEVRRVAQRHMAALEARSSSCRACGGHWKCSSGTVTEMTGPIVRSWKTWRHHETEASVEKKKPTLLKMAPAPQLVTDPVCGMHIDPATAAGHWDYQGTRYYFCNPSCRTRFQADPERYLRTAATGSHAGHADPDPPASTAAHPQARRLRLPDGPRGPAGSPRRLPEVRHGARAGPLDRCRRRGSNTPARCIPRSSATRPAPARSAAWRSSRGRSTMEDAPNPELVDMTRRMWIAAAARPAGVRARDGRHGARHGARRPRRHRGSPTGSAWCARRRSCSGPAGRSSSAAGRRSSTASPTCSR